MTVVGSFKTANYSVGELRWEEEGEGSKVVLGEVVLKAKGRGLGTRGSGPGSWVLSTHGACRCVSNDCAIVECIFQSLCQ